MGDDVGNQCKAGAGNGGEGQNGLVGRCAHDFAHDMWCGNAHESKRTAVCRDGAGHEGATNHHNKA